MLAARAVFLLHTVWWGMYLLGIATRRASADPDPSPAAEAPRTAPLSRIAVGIHSALIVALYPLLWVATDGPQDFAGTVGVRKALSAVVLLLGAGLIGWTTWSFRSYRLRAQLDPGHQLATSGPFAHVRHPIYLAFVLLGVGSALWAPTPPLVAVAIGLAVVGDWRARAEEVLLVGAFGAAYRDYMTRTARLVPGIY